MSRPPGGAPAGAAAAEPRGVRLGLPGEGVGSVASLTRRVGAFAVDAVGSALVAALFTRPQPPRNWSLVAFAVVYVFFTAQFGQTPGMRLLRLRVVRLATGGPLGVVPAVARTALLILLIPALLLDRDLRGLHDRAAGAAVVNSA